jgi:DNA-binding NarL/FixJ family response regulator
LLIADGHEILREGVSHRAGLAGFRVVGSVATIDEAVRACARVFPDILLLDTEMPGRDPLGAIPEVRGVSPSTRIVIFTGFCRDSMIERALNAGVRGYIIKTETAEVLFHGLRAVQAGRTFYSSAVRERMRRAAGPMPEPKTRLRSLTPRELEVLAYIGRGWGNAKMAEVMRLSKRTVERHVSRLMKSLNMSQRTSLVHLAFESGLVPGAEMATRIHSQA